MLVLKFDKADRSGHHTEVASSEEENSGSEEESSVASFSTAAEDPGPSRRREVKKNPEDLVPVYHDFMQIGRAHV